MIMAGDPSSGGRSSLQRRLAAFLTEHHPFAVKQVLSLLAGTLRVRGGSPEQTSRALERLRLAPETPYIPWIIENRIRTVGKQIIKGCNSSVCDMSCVRRGALSTCVIMPVPKCINPTMCATGNPQPDRCAPG